MNHHSTLERVAEIAAKRGIPRAQIALAWVLQKEPVTAPIVGATKFHHLEDAVAAVSVKLDADEIASLEEPYVPHRVYGI
jgi:aryl-alcohol dehydrogenase-like predicted oxidoreductase